MARLLSIATVIVAGIGIFLGFYFLSSQPRLALAVVTGSTVGVAGCLAFVRHVVFHRSDAERLGWQTDRPDWMFEVGFANLAFGLMSLLAVWGKGGNLVAQAIVLFGYAAYLLQAAILHGYRYRTDPVRSPARLWRSVILTLLYAGMMAFFAMRALQM